MLLSYIPELLKSFGIKTRTTQDRKLVLNNHPMFHFEKMEWRLKLHRNGKE